jgi:hypothetical protein
MLMEGPTVVGQAVERRRKDATRQAAWWELWGNIHHQGSVYEATLPAVDLLIALAT